MLKTLFRDLIMPQGRKINPKAEKVELQRKNQMIKIAFSAETMMMDKVPRLVLSGNKNRKKAKRFTMINLDK